MIEAVTLDTLSSAAMIHSLSWQDSHKELCTEAFLRLHDIAHQTEYLKEEMASGKRLFLLTKDKPVGIVSVWDSLIENLYVLPDEQGKGYGTELLLFAISLCENAPKLWILETNTRACALYRRHGFHLTGKRNVLTPTLSEIELCLDEQLSSPL